MGAGDPGRLPIEEGNVSAFLSAHSAATTFCILALGVLASCAIMFEKSPSAVVKAFMAAANEGRYSDAQEMLSEGARDVYVNSEAGGGWVNAATSRARHLGRAAHHRKRP